MTSAVDSPTLSLTPLTAANSEGSEECPFPYQSDDSKEWSPDSPLTPRPGPQRVHCGTQTEGLQLGPGTPEPGGTQASLLVSAAAAAAPAMASCCRSPVPQRKQRHCAKWENRASIMAKETEEDSKSTYESLESDNQRLQKANETLRKKLKEAEREMERLKTMLKRHALHPVEEDSSS